MSSLAAVEETKNKGKVWNGFVCPGCRTVFRVAADFDGREVICPTCQECLKLPEKNQQPPPVERPPVQQPPQPAPQEMAAPSLSTEDHAPAMDDPPRSPALPQRRKLAYTLALPLLIATALILLLARNEGNEKPGAETVSPPPAGNVEIATPSEEPAVVESLPEATASPAAALSPPLEIIGNDPTEVPSDDPPATSAPEPEAPSAPLLPDPEEGLVPAIPDTPGAALPLPPVSDDDSGEHLLHVVRSGETLGKIAQQHQVSVEEIMRANRMPSDHLQAGQNLRIPVDPKPQENPSPETEPETETKPEAQERSQNPVPVEHSAPTENPPPDSPGAPQETPEPIKHTVVRGDNLTRLARKYGCEAADIMKLNGLKNDIIRVGEQLLIPPPAN